MVWSWNRVMWPNSKRNWERSHFWELKLAPSVLQPVLWLLIHTDLSNSLPATTSLWKSKLCMEQKSSVKEDKPIKHLYLMGLLLNNVEFPQTLCMTVPEVRNHSILTAESITWKINHSSFILGNDMSCKNVSLEVHNHPLQTVQSSGLGLWTASWNSHEF